MELTPPKKRAYTPRAPKPDATAIVTELVTLLRETAQQQHAVLAGAMEAQKTQAEMLKTWMSMFAPSSAPTKSTNELDREAIRANADRDLWEPMDPVPSDVLNSPGLF